ncbi:hypothetical protein BHE74_00058634 [Ensete ventricosum]|nr:hypothetical protein BHE74_00058634 [Ensete ventricosum]
MVSMSLMRGNPRAGGGGGGGTSWDCALGSGSSTVTSINPARRVRLRFRCAGDPNRGGQGVPEASRKRRGGDSTGQKRKDRRRSPHKADRASRGKGPADTSVEPPAPRPRLKSVRELCSAQAGVDGRDYHAIRMCNLPKQASDAPLDPDLRLLAHGTPVWQSGEASATYIRGMLFSRLASDLYTLPSEVLMDGATKVMVLWLRSRPEPPRLNP